MDMYFHIIEDMLNFIYNVMIILFWVNFERIGAECTVYSLLYSMIGHLLRI